MKYLLACFVVGLVVTLTVGFYLIATIGLVHLVLTNGDGAGMAGFTLFMGIAGLCVVGWDWARKTIAARPRTKGEA